MHDGPAFFKGFIPVSTVVWGGTGRRRLGGIGGVELEPGLEIADASLQFGDPSLERVEHGQDGSLGFRWDGVPERFRDGRLGDHANNTTELLYKRFGP
jgi:hypothetical protein